MLPFLSPSECSAPVWPAASLLALVLVAGGGCRCAEQEQAEGPPATGADVAATEGPAAHEDAPVIAADIVLPELEASTADWIAVLATPAVETIALDLRAALEQRWVPRAGEPAAGFESALALALLVAPSAELVDGDGEPTPETLRAVALFEPLVGSGSHQLLVLRRLGGLYEVYDHRRAASTWEQVLELAPSDLSVRNRLAEAHSKFGEWDRAYRLAERTVVLADAAGDYEAGRVARYVLGSALTEAGRYVEAERVLKAALVQPDGRHWDCAYQALGVLYARLGGSAPPDGEAEALPLPDEDDPVALSRAALRAYYGGDDGRALTWIEQAAGLRPEARYQVIRGLVLVTATRYDEAGKAFEVAARQDPADPGPRVGLAHLAIVRQDYKAARPPLQEALDTWLRTDLAAQPDPAYHEFLHRMACLGMGWVHANQGSHKHAVAYFDRVLAHRPFDVLARLGKSNSLLGLGDLDAAEAELTGILELEPDNAFARAGLASVQLARGDLTRAEEGFQAALAGREDSYTCPHEGLGLVYLKAGRLDEARDHLQQAIEINPDIEYLKYNALAEIYLAEGRFDEAERLLRKSTANYPHDDAAKLLLKRVEASRAEASEQGEP